MPPVPANLTPEYQEAERRFKAAKTPEEKLLHLEDMLRKIPKHKGTDHMQADLKRRISRLKTGMESQKGRKGYSFYVDRVGLPQIVLVGAPSSGKSSLLAGLTNARPEIADRPFCTQKPLPGVMHMGKVRFQLVDLPAFSDQFMEAWVPQLVRVADMALIVFDLGADSVLEDAEMVLRLLGESRLKLVPGDPDPDTSGGTKEVLAAFIGAKNDSPSAQAAAELLAEILDPAFPFVRVSTVTGEGLEAIPSTVFASLKLIRIFTKAPGKEAALEKPVLLPIGSTVIDVAEEVHKEIAEHLKFARVWGSTKFEGQKVPQDYELHDGDIVELHE